MDGILLMALATVVWRKIVENIIEITISVLGRRWVKAVANFDGEDVEWIFSIKLGNYVQSV